MKQLLTLLFLLSALPGWSQNAALSAGPAVSVEVSRVHCMVRFVETVAGGSGGYVGS